ncbi:MAG: hypothetical protein HYZ50_17455 [Deltaproteobacteria bacterium]|nr:hypothetical protein [Deltaproteobacteria bacterium]
MSELIYNWKRFWCPRGENITLSFEGYLDDPEAELGRYSNPNAKPFEAIAEIPCLILLGEPGLGKTHAIRAEWEATKTKALQRGEDALWFDLRSYGSEDRLVRNLFESREFCAWLDGNYRLSLFLDSLDEGLLQIRVLSSLLADELKKCPVDRLSLRIACRTAEWPESLGTDLQSLWEERAVGVFELTPLRRVDVIEAAQASGINRDSFLAEIERVAAAPLAIKPVTLALLLKTYQRHGTFPKIRAELYREGCRLLCEETNKDRREKRLIGEFSADQRLMVAARIAAVSVFANRYAVWTAVDQGDVPLEDVTVRELSGGREPMQREDFAVGEDAINETLNTGLFSARGANRFGWAHQTYAEFLAAHYLVQHQMTLAQTMNLIVHPGDPEKKLVPQLHETAAWLAGMMPEVFREIMQSDPEVLLRSDVAIAEEADRAALVQALLEKCEAEQSLLRYDWSAFHRFKKLAHRKLSEQLRPYLCDVTKSRLARQVAIDIAEACELRSLQSELVAIALNPSELLALRENAADAVVRVGDKEAKGRLKPLALGEAGDDPNDELKDAGLRALWPDQITVGELFTCLSPPKNRRPLDGYWRFLVEEIPQHLESSHFSTALEWVASQHERDHLHPFEKLADSILLRALEHLEAPGVVEAFAKAVLPRLRAHHSIFRDRADTQFANVWESDESKRRRVLETMLLALSETEEDPRELFYAQLVFVEDLPWMLERLQTSTPQKQQLAWARLIEVRFGRSDFRYADLILAACWDSPVLAEACSWLLHPIKLDSPEAQKERENYEEMQKWQNRKKEEKPLLDPPPEQRIATLLDQCEAGNLEAWWRLNMEMTLEPDSTHYGSELEADLTTLPGWKTAHSTIKARIIEVAKKYLLEQDPHTPDWLGKGIHHRPALAGYRALRFLLQKEPSWLSLLSSDIWKKWASIILAYPIASDVEEEKIQQTLVAQAYLHASEEIGQTLLSLVDEENARYSDIFVLRTIEPCWDDSLSHLLQMKVKEEKLRPKTFGRLLRVLLDRKVEEARNLAAEAMRLSASLDADQRAKAITAACLLMTHTEDSGWSIVWPAIQQDDEFGREVIIAVAYEVDIERIDLSQRLTKRQMVDLYIWMVHSGQGTDDSHLDDDS